MKCLILDDDPFATELIASYVQQIPTLEIAHVFNNPLMAAEVLRQEQIDLILLDVHMPHLTGFELLAQLNTKSPRAANVSIRLDMKHLNFDLR